MKKEPLVKILNERDEEEAITRHDIFLFLGRAILFLGKKTLGILKRDFSDHHKLLAISHENKLRQIARFNY